MRLNVPSPRVDEMPGTYADRVGKWYTSWSGTDKGLGQFFTPLTVARQMAAMLEQEQDHVRILDPGAGVGVLACCASEALNGDISLVAYELESGAAACLEVVLEYLRSWMAARHRTLIFEVRVEDFVLSCGTALKGVQTQLYDVVISNPPYLKIGKNDPRSVIAERVVHGQPNLYALFMAVGVALLGIEGQCVFITPRSYASGEYFKKFREYLFSMIEPVRFHLFESRKDVFADVLQESIILHGRRALVYEDVVVSWSRGEEFLDDNQRRLPLSDVLGMDGAIHLPLSETDDRTIMIMRSWSGRLADYGLIASTGPVVAFRARQWIKDRPGEDGVPLLWIQNVRPMELVWPLKRTGQYLTGDGIVSLGISAKRYVLLRRFSAKEEMRRVTAAPYMVINGEASIGLENHLNYIYRPDGDMTEEEVVGISAYLNSSLIDRYFRVFSGNTQINAAELKRLPLPSLATLVEIGRVVIHEHIEFDSAVNEVLREYA